MKTLFLAPGRGQSEDPGTAERPLRVETAGDFDAVLRAHPRDTVFQLLPGAYETRGAWAFAERDFCALGPGSALVGLEGSSRTTLRLADDYERTVATATGPKPAQKVEMLIAGSRGGSAEDLRIEGLTLDARGGRHAGGSALPTVALHVFASRTVLRDLRVLGVDGKWEGANEGFGILVNNCGDRRVRPGGHRLENCRVECLAGSYVTGLYCGVTQPLDDLVPEPSGVTDCEVYAPWPSSGRAAHAALAANCRTTFHGCRATGFDRFFFCDTGSVDHITIHRCRGDFGYCAIDLPGPVGPGNPIRYRKHIHVTDCVLNATHVTADHVVLLNAQDGSEGSKAFPVHDVCIQGCTVTSDHPGATFYAASVKAAQTSGVRIVGCTMPEARQLGVWPPTPSLAVSVVAVG